MKDAAVVVHNAMKSHGIDGEGLPSLESIQLRCIKLAKRRNYGIETKGKKKIDPNDVPITPTSLFKWEVNDTSCFVSDALTALKAERKYIKSVRGRCCV